MKGICSDSIQYRSDVPMMSMEKGLVGDTINDWWQTPLYDPKTQKISAVFGADGKFDYDATLEALKNMRFTYGIKVSNSSSVA